MDIEKPMVQTHENIPLLCSQFLHNGLPTRLTVFPESLHFQNEKIECAYTINFDLSYDINKEGNGWVLTLICPEVLKFVSVFPLDEWEDVLIGMMKRRRFHEFYKGVKKIGKGNFASVYLTERVQDKMKFAVKAFQKEATFKPTNGKQGLENEIKVLRRLKHPNITRLEGVFQTQNSIYLIMQLINGKSLGEILDQQKTLPPATRRKILKGILSGLAEMQTQSIVHRDIKPQNIMITENGEAKLVDFGLATDTRLGSYLYVRCGTPGFVAPEIIGIRDTEQARMSTISDVFSAGAIMYQMVFGKPLFQGEKNSEVLERNRRCLVSIPTSSELATYEELILLRRMLDVFPDTRITAHQALRSSYFQEQKQRTPFQEVHLGQQIQQSKNLPPLKYSAAIRPRRVRRVQNNQN